MVKGPGLKELEQRGTIGKRADGARGVLILGPGCHCKSHVTAASTWKAGWFPGEEGTDREGNAEEQEGCQLTGRCSWGSLRRERPGLGLSPLPQNLNQSLHNSSISQGVMEEPWIRHQDTWVLV